MVLLLITVVCMALNPTSLLVLAGLAVGWLYLFVLRATPLVIGGRTIRLDCSRPHCLASLLHQAVMLNVTTLSLLAGP